MLVIPYLLLSFLAAFVIVQRVFREFPVFVRFVGAFVVSIVLTGWVNFAAGWLIHSLGRGDATFYGAFVATLTSSRGLRPGLLGRALLLLRRQRVLRDQHGHDDQRALSSWQGTRPYEERTVQKSEYARLAEFEQSYWWHLGRLEIIQTYMKRASRNRSNSAILNVGCGTGGTIDMLERFGKVDNVDTSDDAINFAEKLGYGNITRVDDIDLPFKDETYDVVGAFDVLEHIEDHRSALSEWKRVLKDDGAIVITVPAYQWLWSGHDISSHHRRRYTMKSLMTVAAEAGLRPERKSYAISFSLPLVAGFRLAGRVLDGKADSKSSYVPVPRVINRLFTALLKVEAKMHNTVSLPAGTSIITILRKIG